MRGRHAVSYRAPRWEVGPALIGFAWILASVAYFALAMGRL